LGVGRRGGGLDIKDQAAGNGLVATVNKRFKLGAFLVLVNNGRIQGVVVLGADKGKSAVEPVIINKKKFFL